MDKFIDWMPRAKEEVHEHLQNNPKAFKRIQELLKDIQKSPYKGIGKPEPLKYDLSGWYSRRIDKTNRLVYLVTDEAIIILSCKYHY